MTKDKLQKYGKEYPIIIYNNIPKEKEHEALLESLRNQIPLYLFSEYYTKFNHNNVKTLLKNSMHLDEYVEDKPKLKQLYQHALFRNSTKIDVAYIPLHSREKWVTSIFDLNSMRIIDTIDINPHKYADEQYKKKRGKNRLRK